MPAPIVPIAWTALRLGAVAALALYAARGRSQPKQAEHERVLDALPEGLGAASAPRRGRERAARRRAASAGCSGLRRAGPGIEIDAAGARPAAAAPGRLSAAWPPALPFADLAVRAQGDGGAARDRA